MRNDRKVRALARLGGLEGEDHYFRHWDRLNPLVLEGLARQLVAKAIVTEGQIIDVFTAAGLKKPDISVLSEEFLAEVRGMKHKNVAAELLEKLVKDEPRTLATRNLVQSQQFSEMLKSTLRACLRIARGPTARDFGDGRGGEVRASPQRAVRIEPTKANGKRPAARRVFASKAVWLRCFSVRDRCG